MGVVDWLLEGDPAIRWQVLRDLTDAGPDEVAAERARVAREGWGARLLALQDPEGTWDGGTYRPGWADESRPFFDAWSATHFSLQALWEYGVDPSDAGVRQAIERVRSEVAWDESDGGGPYFSGAPEPCMSGVLLGIATYFGQDASPALAALFATQLEDGGWNCDPSPVSSFHTTICVLEGLLAWERSASPGDPRLAQAREARIRGEEYLLERRLLWRRSTNQLIDPRFAMPSYPVRWFYDVLRGLDYLRIARPGGEPRAAEAIELLRSRAHADGRWPLENKHKGPTLFKLQGEWDEGRPSRWITLQALRVLRWADGSVRR